MDNIKSFFRAIPLYLKAGLVALFISLSSSAYAVDPITVEGNRIMFGSSDAPIAGNSFFWSNEGWGAEVFHNAELVSWLNEDWDSKIIRVAMGVEEEGGYLTFPEENLNRVKTVIDAAIENDMYVIVDWHTQQAEKNEDVAIDFFKEIATEYGESDNVIYEIYNEPAESDWDNDIKPYAERVIEEIREIDSDNLIIVGTSSWSQDVDIAADNPIDTYDNIAYTLHFYAGINKQDLRDRAQEALDSGIALFVTEWATVDTEGVVDKEETDLWVDFMKENHLSHLNWAINDQDDGSSILFPGASPTGSWPEDDLTESGVLAKRIIRTFNANGELEAEVEAVDGSGKAYSGVQSTLIDDVTFGDSINDEDVFLGVENGNATISEFEEWPAGISLDTDTGIVTSDETIADGAYVLKYELCDLSFPITCATADLYINIILNLPPEVVDDESEPNQTVGESVSVSVLDNDNDPDPDPDSGLDPSSVAIVVDDSGDLVTTLTVEDEGVWVVEESGAITFTPESGFEDDPEPIFYSVKDKRGLESGSVASLSIDYAEVTKNVKDDAILLFTYSDQTNVTIGGLLNLTMVAENTTSDPVSVDVVSNIPTGFSFPSNYATVVSSGSDGVIDDSDHADAGTVATSGSNPIAFDTITIPEGEKVEIGYAVEVAQNAPIGDAVNRAQAFAQGSTTDIASNIAASTVSVTDSEIETINEPDSVVEPKIESETVVSVTDSEIEAINEVDSVIEPEAETESVVSVTDSEIDAVNEVDSVIEAGSEAESVVSVSDSEIEAINEVGSEAESVVSVTDSEIEAINEAEIEAESVVSVTDSETEIINEVETETTSSIVVEAAMKTVASAASSNSGGSLGYLLIPLMILFGLRYPKPVLN